MAIQPMALGVQNPQINAVQAMAEGQQAGQQQQMNQINIAKANLAGIAEMAHNTGGDPAKWEQGLDMLETAGLPVQSFRGRADLAPLVAKSAFSAAEQVAIAQDERSYGLALQKFEHELAEAAKGPKPTSDMQNFHLSQQDPKFAEYMTAQNAPNPPSGVAEYNFYAQQETEAGRKPMTVLEYEQAKKGNGFSVTTADGTTVQMGGSAKPLTEGQSKDTVFVTRANGALPIIDKFGDALTNLGSEIAGNTPVVGNFMKSPEYQQAEQSGKEFLQAILRKDTGAAITPQETAEYGSVYLPRPGDSPEVLAQKKTSRSRAVIAIEAGLPPTAILASEQALLKNGDTSAPPALTATPSIADGAIIENDAGERMVLRNGQWEKM